MKLKPVYFLIFLLFLSHIPFLTADPDRLVDIHTRGAWTDEGLYAAQARNFVNYGTFGITENTTFVRGPLFNFIQVPAFYFFGTSLPIARLITVVITCFTLLCFGANKKLELFAVFLTVLLFTHFRIFNFSHYAMAEMVAISFVMISFIFLNMYFENGKLKFLFLSSLMIFGTYCLKNQFFYLIVLLPAVVLFFNTIRFFRHEINGKKFTTDFLHISGFTIALFVVYIIIWYLPNKEFYDSVMLEATHNRFQVWGKIKSTLQFNYNYYIHTLKNLTLLIGFVLALLLGIFSLFFKSGNIKNHLIIIFGFIWILIESHKLAFTHLPQRYLLGMYAAIAFFSSAVLYQYFNRNNYFKYSLPIALVAALFFNMEFNQKAYNRRTYEIKTITDYLYKYNWNDKTIVGVWAPSLTWNTKAKVIPVWKSSFTTDELFDTINPAMIITEADEAEAEQFYINNGIDLKATSDSCKQFGLWRYNIDLFWMYPDD